MDARHAGTRSHRLVAGAQVARRAALAVVGLATLAFAAPAAATTETFNYTGAAQTWTVPAGVTSATFDLYGAQGGGFNIPTFAPGLGGRATATIAVTPGASIQVNVGGEGVSFNGGGAGGARAQAGGGASDIRIGGSALADRVLVAGGGGAAGGGFCGHAVSGGNGGGESGEPGLADTAGVCAGSVAGGGGTPTDGGSATSPATEGDFGFGGDGGGNLGGGGGGGWYGGGGGLNSAGGGGGSGHGPDGTVFQTGVRSGDGLVTVSYSEICKGRAATIVALPGLPTTGTDGADVISGTQEADVIDAGLGDDLVCARGGADQVNGGEGADRLRTGAGSDTIGGDAGADALRGDGAGDSLSGGEGDDIVRGRGGSDSLDGNAGNNRLYGGLGTDACVNGPVLKSCELTTFESVCEDGLDGTFSTSVNPFTNTIVWRCDFQPLTQDQWLANDDTLKPFCPGNTGGSMWGPGGPGDSAPGHIQCNTDLPA